MGTISIQPTIQITVHGVESLQVEASVNKNSQIGLVISEYDIKGLGLSCYNPQNFNIESGTVQIKESTAFVECAGQTKGVLITIVSTNIQPMVGKPFIELFEPAQLLRKPFY